MKHEVFNQYVERVVDLFGITKEDFFSKNKKRAIVDARQLVYYLCAKRPMQITYIEKYMSDAGYIIKHSSIIHGISAVEKKIAKDKDYVSVVKEVEGAVFIIDKYNPNAPETEEDGLIAGRLRLLKVLRQFEARTGRTHNLLPLQNNTQQPMESNLLAEKMTEEQKQATKFAKERNYVLNKGLALYLLYGEAPRDEWEEPIPNWVKKLPEGKALTKL